MTITMESGTRHHKAVNKAVGDDPSCQCFLLFGESDPMM